MQCAVKILTACSNFNMSAPIGRYAFLFPAHLTDGFRDWVFHSIPYKRRHLVAEFPTNASEVA